MKEYRKIAKFKYDNNYYVMYLDNNNKHFFLKISDGNLCYVTTEELLKLTEIFTSTPLYMKIERSGSVKFAPKVIKGGVSLLLSVALLSSCVMAYNEKDTNDFVSNDTALEFISTDDDLTSEKDFTLDTYREGSILNYLYIYDMDYLDKAFSDETVSKEELFEIVDLNKGIPQVYKKLLHEYIEAVMDTYPNVELRVFKENLKTLKIYECSDDELQTKLGSSSYVGTYSKKENAIYVLENKKYEKGSWDYQVMFHELSHCLRTGIYKDESGKDIQISFEGKTFHNNITSEALNSLFAVSLFDNESGEVAYQLQSNYYSVMLECMDNYDLSDYVNHSQSYFVKKLDEAFDTDEATVILDLIQMQYNDYYNSEIEVEQSEYYPIYDYLCNMYFKKYISADCSYDEAYEVAKNLLNKIVYNVPLSYNIDYTRFFKNLDTYCENINIPSKTR